MGRKGGFENAILTKGICISTAFISFVVLTTRSSDKLNLDLTSLFSRGEVWRVLTSFVTFSSTGEAFCGLMLLYIFRVFERQMGSVKYGSFLASTGFVGKLLEIGGLSFFGGKFRPRPGPYAAIYASFVLYYATIPSVGSSRNASQVSLFNDKTFTYLLGAQLMWSHGQASILPAACGLLAGLLYRSRFLRFDTFRLPRRVQKGFQALKPLFDNPEANARHQQLRRLQQAQRFQGNNVGVIGGNRTNAPGGQGNRETLLGGHGMFGGPPPILRHRATAVHSPPPSEAQITSLMDMGFDREASIRALRSTQNNVEAAANRLLAGM
mmetsp:Transcript_38585/g.49865  ORF Transcript_38585/g.49865 Transcript_38585/m.49865 type:complete len:324 (-) Transcript_38585:313-1284(-)